MDEDKALPGHGISIQNHRNVNRYHYDDFSGLSSSPPPSVHREPPKITIRKSKFYSLLGAERTPTIPEEGTAETDSWKRKETTGTERTNDGLTKSMSSPSLNTLNKETDSFKITGEIMKQDVKALTTGLNDIAAPHSSIESEPASKSVLKMVEKAHRRTYSDDIKEKDLTVFFKEVKTPKKSQSVPASPHASPPPRRRNLSGDKTIAPAKASLTSAVMEHFTGSGLPKTSEHEGRAMSSIKSLYQWSSKNKMKVGNRDLNMFTPTSF